jgi:hypothetical protein
MFKKLTLSVLTAVFLLLNVATPFVHAQEPGHWYNQGFEEWYAKVYDTDNPEEIFGERYTAAQVWWVVYGLIAFIMNAMSDSAVVACVMKYAGSDLFKDKCEGLFIEFLSLQSANTESQGFLATISTSPVSSVAYFKDVAQRINPVTDVHAQGFGFEAVNPVLILWRAVRNLTYFLLIFAVVAMAFMIMFRVKLSPQTVITVQSAIPKIFIAILLITFSYAIAGFLIDLMYVVIGLIVSILTSAGLTTFSWTELFGALTNQRSVLSLMTYYFLAFIVIFVFALFSNPVGGGLGLIGLGLGLGTGTAGTMLVIFLILFVILLIVLLILAFKIWFMLIKAFVNILLLIIVAPIQILLGVFGFGGFGIWLRSMVANLAVFPAVGVMFFVAYLFLAGGFPSNVPDWLRDIFTQFMPLNVNAGILVAEEGLVPWSPPLTWGTADMDLLWVAVSIVIISLIPKTADMIKSMIQGRPFAYGTAIGEAAALGVPFVGATAGAVKEGNWPWPLSTPLVQRRIPWIQKQAIPAASKGGRFANWMHETGQQKKWWS